MTPIAQVHAGQHRRASNLTGVKLLGRKKDNSDSDNVADSALSEADGGQSAAGTTAPKGRPTPKRSEAARKRGPVAPAPMTAAEARRRRKEIGGPKLTRGERKADKVARRADMSERREKMMAGEDAYLLPRDKGPVRRFVRDAVDSRRNVLGLFMPPAIAESTGAGQPVHYLATGASPEGDPDWSARIAAHRARRPSHWSTVETIDIPTQLRSKIATPTLVDDIGGWLTAMMDRRGAWAMGAAGSVTAHADDLIDAVGALPSPLAPVSPGGGLTLVPHTASGPPFAAEPGSLHQ